VLRRRVAAARPGDVRLERALDAGAISARDYDRVLRIRLVDR